MMFCRVKQSHCSMGSNFKPLSVAFAVCSFRRDERTRFLTICYCSLFPRVVTDRLSIGREDLEMMEAGIHARVSPDNLLGSRDFK